MIIFRHIRTYPRWLRVGLAATASITAATVLFVTPATAHNVLVDSTPEDGSTLTDQLDTVELVFDQPVQDQFTQMAVLDADETPRHEGEPQVADNTVRLDVGELADGDYTISYRVISADGHPVSGTIDFTMATGQSGGASGHQADADSTDQPDPAVTDQPTAADQDETGTGEATGDNGTNVPLLASGGAAAVLVVAGIAFLVTHGRKGDAEDSETDDDPTRPGGDGAR